jgi:2-haloacid dehalogenase
VRLLNLAPAEVMLVAAHNGDLKAAAATGMRTGFVARPAEYGPQQRRDLVPEGAWDVIADSFHGLADALGCPP